MIWSFILKINIHSFTETFVCVKGLCIYFSIAGHFLVQCKIPLLLEHATGADLGCMPCIFASIFNSSIASSWSTNFSLTESLSLWGLISLLVPGNGSGCVFRSWSEFCWWKSLLGNLLVLHYPLAFFPAPVQYFWKKNLESVRLMCVMYSKKFDLYQKSFPVWKLFYVLPLPSSREEK